MKSVWRTARAVLCAGWLAVLGSGPAWAGEAPPRLAKGLIVKLKDPTASRAARSVVRLHAAAMSRESAWRLSMGLAAAAHRRGVYYRSTRATAFAAQLVNADGLQTYAQAEADAERLRADPAVEWVVVNEVAHAAAVPVYAQGLSDPAYAGQTWLHEREDTPGGRRGVANIAAAWDALNGRTLSPVVVAVLDNGVLYPDDLDGRLLPGYDFVSEVAYSGDFNGLDNDPSDPGLSLYTVPEDLRGGCSVDTRTVQWHGLRIASMLAELPNGTDGVGILAPVPEGKVLPVRVGGMCGAAVSDIIEGMLWAAGVNYQGSPALNPNPARVVNLSFGGDGSCADSGRYDAAWMYRDAVATLASHGVLVVASAGNGDASTGLGLSGPTRPANCAGVLAVTGLDQRGYKARYANLVNAGQYSSVAVASGDVDASGYLSDDGVLTLANTATLTGSADPIEPASSYAMQAVAGTSFAAPTVAGVAAMMLAVNPTLSVADLKWALTTQVAGFPSLASFPSLPVCQAGQDGQGNCVCTTTTCGAGVLDALQAVNWAIAQIPATPGGSTGATASVTSTSCFKPERLGGGSSCDSGGGGGGAVDLGVLWGLAGLTALRVRRRALRAGKG